MNQTRALQVAVAVAGLVPVTAGALGAFRPGLLALAGAPSALTHVAYLSGLLLGIGLGFWSLIPLTMTRWCPSRPARFAPARTPG